MLKKSTILIFLVLLISALSGQASISNVRPIINAPYQVTSNVVDGDFLSGVFTVEVFTNFPAVSGYAYVDGKLYANLDLSAMGDKFDFNTLAFGDGPHTFTFEATDETTTATLNVDFNIQNGPNLELKVNITDGDILSGLVNIEVTSNVVAGLGSALVNDKIYANLDLSDSIDTFPFNTFAFNDGIQYFKFEAYDVFSNLVTLQVKIEVKNDWINPEVSSDLVAGSTYTGELTFSVFVSELATVDVLLDSTKIDQLVFTNASVSQKVTIGTSLFEEGGHTFTLAATDLSGNNAEVIYSVNFRNDFIEPNVLAYEIKDLVAFYEMFTFEFNFSEQVEGTASVEGKIVNEFSGTSIFFEFDTYWYINGLYELFIEFTDRSGNYNNGTYEFYIENLDTNFKYGYIEGKTYSGLEVFDTVVDKYMTHMELTITGANTESYNFTFSSDGKESKLTYTLDTTLFPNGDYVAEFSIFKGYEVRLTGEYNIIIYNEIPSDPTSDPTDDITSDPTDDISSDPTDDFTSDPTTNDNNSRPTETNSDAPPDLPLPGFSNFIAIIALVGLTIVNKRRK